jgi:alpha-L-glutamate ligase-like protein
MAMIRLSCAASGGKANLHQGAVGVGLCMNSGAAVNAVQNNQEIILHPDTQAQLIDIKIPNWEDLLKLACRCYDMSGLGYLGVDIVLDKIQGATLLELNARPGLSIQIANKAGLLPRLRMVEELTHPERMSIDERVAFAQKNF